ncbi:MAG: hypothetical protein ACRD1A_02680 [Terriglobales bacterium]
MGLNGAPPGTDITNGTEDVAIGQEVSLKGNCQPEGNTCEGVAWSVQGTTMSAWSHGSQPAGVVAGANPTTVFWIAPGQSQQVALDYSYLDADGGEHDAYAYASFDASGPSTYAVTTTHSYWQVTGKGIELGDIQSSVFGVQFSSSPTAPSSPTGVTNNLLWEQIIETGTQTSCKVGTTSYGISPQPVLPGLDNTDPYTTGSPAHDNPSQEIFQYANDITVKIVATIYLFWSPGFTDAQYVPLGYVPWTATGHGSLITGLWQIQDDSAATPGAFVSPTSYPTWDPANPVKNGLVSCDGSSGEESLRSVAARGGIRSRWNSTRVRGGFVDHQERADGVPGHLFTQFWREQ